MLVGTLMCIPEIFSPTEEAPPPNPLRDVSIVQWEKINLQACEVSQQLQETGAP